LIKGGCLISAGVNKTAAPKRFTPQREGMHLHAEIDCLVNIDRDKSKNAVMYVAGKTAANNLMKTKPCKECQQFIGKMGVKRVVYQEYEELKELVW